MGCEYGVCGVVFNPLSLCPTTSLLYNEKYIRFVAQQHYFVWQSFVRMFTLTKPNVMFLYINSPVDPVKPQSIIILILFIIFFVVAFILRNTIFGFLWVIVQSFFIALGITIAAGIIKDTMKNIFKD